MTADWVLSHWLFKSRDTRKKYFIFFHLLSATPLLLGEEFCIVASLIWSMTDAFGD